MSRKVVLITGCSSGLGKSLCEELKRKDYFVVATARRLESLNSVSADLKLCIDVEEEESIQSAVDKIINEVGRIDILINNAGFSARASVEEIQMSIYNKMMNVNVLGTVRMIQAVLPYMRKQAEGKILNIGSISGRMTGIINGAYCSSKYAVEAITQATRYEVSEYGIQVCVIEPGAMETGFFDTLVKNSNQQMHNNNSPYQNLYQRDEKYRANQKRASVEVCAKEIVRIMEKRNLKIRYTVAVSFIFRLFVHLPEHLKEIAIKKFN